MYEKPCQCKKIGIFTNINILTGDRQISEASKVMKCDCFGRPFGSGLSGSVDVPLASIPSP